VKNFTYPGWKEARAAASLGVSPTEGAQVRTARYQPLLLAAVIVASIVLFLALAATIEMGVA
jgi:hypothetical protein